MPPLAFHLPRPGLARCHRPAPTRRTGPACRSAFALPMLLVATPAAFYALLWARGMSLDEAREAGWVSKPNVSDAPLQPGLCLCLHLRLKVHVQLYSCCEAQLRCASWVRRP